MVSAIEASSGIITCGIFGSIMWWPEAELRSCVEAAGMRLSSQERIRSLKSGRESPGAAMSKVLRRYFTPSSAALAQATLERMHSSGDLQGSLVSADVMSSQPQELEESDARVQPAAGGEQQPPPPDHVTSPSKLLPQAQHCDLKRRASAADITAMCSHSSGLSPNQLAAYA